MPANVKGHVAKSSTDTDTKAKESTSTKALIVVATAIITGAVSYGFGVVNDIRKTRIEHVNAQIEKLYGPLFAASQADNEVWNLFNKHDWRNQDAKDENPNFFDDKHPPTPEQVKRWRHWMITVFQPLNLKMEEAIVNNSHLLIGDTVPPAFKTLIAHTEAYRAVIAAWRDEDLSKCQGGSQPCEAATGHANTSGINFPDSVITCIAEDYAQLKRRQQDLEGSFLAVLSAETIKTSASCD